MSPITAEPAVSVADYDTDTEIVIVETRMNLFAAPTGWRPAVNAYRCQDKFLVFVDLAGVPPESVKLTVQPARLVIRGTRLAPEPGALTEMTQLLALEIDDGTFERVLELPQAVNPDDVTTEYRDGLFRIALGLKA